MSTPTEFVNRHLPALLDIHESFHAPCHIRCTNRFAKKSAPGWRECHDFCGRHTVELMDEYFGITEDGKFREEFNNINHLYLPCTWTREKKSCVEEYKQALIELFTKFPIYKDVNIEAHARTKIRNFNPNYYEQTYFVATDTDNPYFELLASYDMKNNLLRMVNLGNPFIFVADYDNATLEFIQSKIQEVAPHDTWAIYETSKNHYHIMNLSRKINVDSDEAQELTNRLESDKKYLKLSKKNRKYLLRFTPKYYPNYSDKRARRTNSPVPQFIGFFTSEGAKPINSTLLNIFEAYNKLLDQARATASLEK